jgi:hypothetical protein
MNVLEREKRTNKARQRLARETGISGGAPVNRRTSRRNVALLRLQSLCAMPAEIVRSRARFSWLLLSAMRFSKSKLPVCIQNPVRLYKCAQFPVPPAPLFVAVHVCAACASRPARGMRRKKRRRIVSQSPLFFFCWPPAIGCHIGYRGHRYPILPWSSQ